MKALRTISILIAFAAATPTLADDTDIYIRTTPDETAGDAYVMLALDWRPNLGSSVCSDQTLCQNGDGSEGVVLTFCDGVVIDGDTCQTGEIQTQMCTDPDTSADIGFTIYNACEETFGEYMPERYSCVWATDQCVDVNGVVVDPNPDGTCNDPTTLVEAGDPATKATRDASGDPVCAAGGTAEDNGYTFFDIIIAALRITVEPLENIHLGLMMSHSDTRESSNGCSGPNPPAADANCSNGGFIFSGFKDMDIDAQKTEFFKRLSQIPIPEGNEAHQYQGREMYFEFYRYLTGQHVYNGHNGWADYGTDNDRREPFLNIDDPMDVSPYLDQQSLWPFTYEGIVSNGSWDKTIEELDPTTGKFKYISPLLEAGECPNIFVVNLMHQVSNQEVESDTAIAVDICPDNYCDVVRDGGMGLQPANEGTQIFPQTIRFMVDLPQLAPADLAPNGIELPSIRSFFLVDESKINDKTTRYAQAGLTQVPYALSDNPEDLQGNLNSVFTQILSTSSTFVAPSVPVNVFNRAEAINNVYLSLFQPAEAGTPQWAGNLKMVKIEYDANLGTRVLIDQNGQNAVGADGRLAPSALTFWTIADELPPPQQGETDFTADADGRGVKRGAAGQVMPGSRENLLQMGPGTENPLGDTNSLTARKLFTEPSIQTNGNPDALLPFNATISTAQTLLADDDALNQMLVDYVAATLDASDTAESVMLDILRHSRGIDVTDEDGDGSTTDSRPWFFGDALHGRPLPINYGGDTEATQDIRVMMTNNDGWVRMIGVGDTDGVEDWAFMPRAVMPKLLRLMNNTPALDPVHPYLVDGDMSLLLVDNDGDGRVETAAPDNDRVVVVLGQRRGGKNYWALDVSNPDDPRLLWTIGKNDTCDPDTNDFCELGQTWSAPRATYVTVDFDENPGNPNPQDVLAFVFGGGYNGDDDSDLAGDLGKDARVSQCSGTQATVCDGGAILGCSVGALLADGSSCAAPGAVFTCSDGSEPRLACFDESSNEIDFTQTDQQLLGTDDDEGNAVFIVNAFTGELIWKAVQGGGTGVNPLDSSVFTHVDLTDSIPAEIALVDTDANQRLDRLYVPDTGGNVWRGDFASANRADWTLTRIASVGRHYASGLDGGATVTDDRRIFPKVDVVRSSDSLGDYDGIAFGTGDRAHPLASGTEEYFYLIKDRNTASGSPPASLIEHDEVLDLSDNCLVNGDINDCSSAELTVDNAQLQLNKGWRIRLEQCEGFGEIGVCGEKSLSSPLIVQGVVLFNTYLPPKENVISCAPKEGSGLLYAVSLEQAAPVFNFNETNDTSGIILDRFEQLTSGGIPSQLVPIGYGDVLRGDLKFTTLPGFSGAKTFWYEEDRASAPGG